MSASKVRAPPKPRQPYITKVGQKKKEEEEVIEVVEEVKPTPKLFEGQQWMERGGFETRRPDAIETIKISSQQKDILIRTWESISVHMADSGTRIFLRIFELSPTVRDVFNYAGPDTDPVEVANNPRLKYHALAFMQALDDAVTNIDSLTTKVAPVFINLGKHHIHFPELKGNYFDLFCGAMMYVFREDLGDAFTPDTRQAWSHMFDYLLQHMKFGWELAIEEQHAREAAEK